MENTERRYLPAEVRVDTSTGKPKLAGFAVVYDRDSRVLYDPQSRRSFVEVVKPGAFGKTLAGDAEVKADVGHAMEAVIGRRSKGTLKLEDRPEGLWTEIDPPNNTLGNDALEDVRHGNIDGMSFQFRVLPGGESWARDGQVWRRTLTDLELQRVSITNEPAYPDTSVALRSLTEAEKSETDAAATQEQKQEQSKEEVRPESDDFAWYEAKVKVMRMQADHQ